jgi:hypothetical protein
VWIRSDVLNGCAGRSVVEVDDRDEVVRVVKVDHELAPDQTLEQVRDWYAELHDLTVVGA